MEYYMHHVPGRLRVKIPLLRQRPHMAKDIETLLDIYGVGSVNIKSMTGSVVINYDTDLVQAEQLLRLLSDSGYFDMSNAATIDDTMRCAASNTAAKVGKALFGWGVSRALEASGLGLLAAFI